MSKLIKFLFIFALVAIVFSTKTTPVQAQNFDLLVKHNINGRSLGLTKELPVDVYVNGNKAFTFSFGESVSTSLPAGNYFIEVKLAGTAATVMTLGPTDIPEDVFVTIRAQLGSGKTPTLRVNVK